MISCASCKKSVMQVRLERTNPKGEIGIWMCIECIRKEHPELAANIIEDREPIDDILDEICYGKSN